MTAKTAVTILIGVAFVITLIAIGYWYWYRNYRNASSHHPNAQPEVFCYLDPNNLFKKYSDAEAYAKAQGWEVASPSQVQAAFEAGAQWCAAGFASDGNTYLPYHCAVPGCSNQDGVTKNDCKKHCGLLAYAVKPARTGGGSSNDADGNGIWPFTQSNCNLNTKWSQFS